MDKQKNPFLLDAHASALVANTQHTIAILERIYRRFKNLTFQPTAHIVGALCYRAEFSRAWSVPAFAKSSF